jgi:hypothetical protein
VVHYVGLVSPSARTGGLFLLGRSNVVSRGRVGRIWISIRIFKGILLSNGGFCNGIKEIKI